VLYEAFFRKTEAEEIINRTALIKGLTTREVEKRISRILDRWATQKCINIVTRTVWNTFYDQVWRVRCEKVQEWERKVNITGKMKKGARTKRRSGKKTKRNKRTKEEEKEKKAEKINRMKKEAWKSIDMLVTEGGRPFWYGFK